MSSLTQQIEQAFDYRGDVTLELLTGEKIEGYLSNRDGNSVTLFAKDSPAPKTFSYSEIRSIDLSGADCAAGKSWEEWQVKREKEKAKLQEKLKQQS